MKKLKKSTVIASIIIALNKQEANLEDFFLYIKKLSIYVKQYGYCINEIDESDITKFFSMFPYLGTIKKNKISLTQKISDKVKDFFFSEIDKEIFDPIASNNKYIFPIINNGKLINYYFVSDNSLLENIKEEFYYDSINNNAYLIDLEIIKEKDKYNNVYLFLKNFLEKELILKKESFDYKEVNEYFDLCYSLMLENSDISNVYKAMFYYCNIANNNKINLEPYEKVKTL